MTPKPTRVKLPKLGGKKFNGRMHEWHEFWDSFESTIDRNENPSDVDKFSYARGLIKGPAKSATDVH